MRNYAKLLAQCLTYWVLVNFCGARTHSHQKEKLTCDLVDVARFVCTLTSRWEFSMPGKVPRVETQVAPDLLRQLQHNSRLRSFQPSVAPPPLRTGVNSLSVAFLSHQMPRSCLALGLAGALPSGPVSAWARLGTAGSVGTFPEK